MRRRGPARTRAEGARRGRRPVRPRRAGRGEGRGRWLQPRRRDGRRGRPRGGPRRGAGGGAAAAQPREGDPETFEIPGGRIGPTGPNPPGPSCRTATRSAVESIPKPSGNY
ncbi:hypothetical protein FZ103_24160 [Streptomonospora sp. PA3]|nr:hypothetical protein [Streptomonospora sp. PA3]